MVNSIKSIKTPFFSTRPQKKRTFVKKESKEVSEVVGIIEPGCEIFGLTKGQISMIEIIEYILKATGPANVVIATWTASQHSMDQAQTFLENGSIKKLKFLIDPSFKARKLGICEDPVKKFGKSSVRTFRNHAKFILIKNDFWNIVVRTSMNLNQNPRMEYVEISDCKIMHDFMNSIILEIFEKIPEDKIFDRTKATDESILEFTPPTKNLFENFEMDEFDEFENFDKFDEFDESDKFENFDKFDKFDEF